MNVVATLRKSLHHPRCSPEPPSSACLQPVCSVHTSVIQKAAVISTLALRLKWVARPLLTKLPV